MFERNRIHNSNEPTAIPVEISFTTGEQAKGKLIVPLSRSPLEHLNGLGTFVEFEPYGGERQFIAKTQIAAVRPSGVPVSPTLGQPRVSHDDFDPYAILGLTRGCSWDDVRQAYVRLSKTYHPDRYSNAALPAEVKSYLEAMARRLNAAYAALEAVQRAAKQAPSPRYAPVFTSGPQI
jgi:hypothetical protein